MINNIFGLIYTGEANIAMRDLTYSRSIAAVPFGGRYRCIDFVLSSLVNSGVTNVGMIMQKNYHSLMDHLGSGKEWDLSRKRDGLFILPPFLTKENAGIYKGSVDALRSVMGYIRRSAQPYVLLTGSHTIYNTTFNDMLRQHHETGAAITIMYSEEKHDLDEDPSDDLRLSVGPDGRVTDMEINPYKPFSRLRSCDAMIMEKTLLEYLVEETYSRAGYDFIRDVLIKNVNTLKIYGWRYDGYVARLDSLYSFFVHNMALLDATVRRDLFNPEHPVYTKVKDEVPALYSASARAKNCIAADGCVIEGEAENCVLFRGVKIGRDAKVKNCILMQGTNISGGCDLDYVISDKGVTVSRNIRLAGYDRFPIILRKSASI